MFIGVLDSGLGGLSVERRIREHLPEAAIEFVADQAHAPYGDKPLSEIRTRAIEITDQMIEDGAGTVVIACNSASAAALHELRKRHPGVSFVGMEPAVKPAVARTQSGVIGVLATTATVEGTLLAKVVDEFAQGVKVLSTPCVGWVEMIEAGLAEGPQAVELVKRYVDPMLAAGADTLVLACTHFPFLRGTLEAVAPDVELIDPADAVARQVDRVAMGIDTAAQTRFRTTGDPVRFRQQLGVLLGLDVSVSAY